MQTYLCNNQNNVINLPSIKFDIFMETKSYAAITGCVLEHILTTNNLTNCEKLYYILADSLALISKNKGNHRAASLPSEDWAERLGCSRSLVFIMQQSLVKKGYFIISKDFDKIGRNKRNLIIPTLPPEVFNYLNEKYPNRVWDSTPYNPLTECKRSYLDRTKLFIKLNYDLLKIITSNEYLNPGQKVIWLGFYTRCYKNYILQVREGFRVDKYNHNDGSADDGFSFISSYKEIASIHSCNTKHLSKSIRILEELGFIKAQNFYIRKKYSDNYGGSSCTNNYDANHDCLNNNYCDVQERQDKSLWKITLALPKTCILELAKVKDRSNLKLKDSEGTVIDNILHPNLVGDCLILGGIKFNLNPEQASSLKSVILVDGNDIADNTSTSPYIDFPPTKYIDPVIEEHGTIDELTELNTSAKVSLSDISFKNSPLEIFGAAEEKNYGIKSDPHVAKSGLLLNRNLEANNKNIDNKSVFLKRSEFYENFLEGKAEKDETELETIQYAKHTHQIFSLILGYKELNQRNELGSLKHSLDALKLKTVNSERTGKIIKFSPKTLKFWHPLTSEQVYELNSRSGRQFSINFANQLLLKLADKYPTRVFAFKNQFMSYMTKAFLHEKHQGPMVNHDTFRFVLNDKEGRNEREKQKYLSKVEYSLSTNKQSQLGRKIAARFESSLAYQLLTSCRFDHLLKENLFKVGLAPSVNLTKHDQQLLTNEIKSVYGEVEITYTKLEDFNNFKESKTQAWQGVSSGSYIKASHRLDGEIYIEELDQDSAWYKIRKKLKNHFGAAVDRSWFSRLISEEGKEPGKILLKAPSNFIKDWINDNYGLIIAQYCKMVEDLEFDKIIVAKLPDTA